MEGEGRALFVRTVVAVISRDLINPGQMQSTADPITYPVAPVAQRCPGSLFLATATELF